MMNHYNLRFRAAFNVLNISQEQFVEEFNSSEESDIILTQSRLSLMLSGKTYVPIDVVSYLCSGDEPYNMNIDYFTLKSNNLFKIREEVKQTAREVKSLWGHIKEFFSSSLYNK